MRRPSLLEEEGKERGNKWVVYCVVAVGVVIGAGIFVSGFYLLDVETYIHDTKQVPTLNEFYETFNASDNTTSVFFIGNSMVGFSVYPPEINRILTDSGYSNISAYNLQMSGGSYNEYILQLDKMTMAKPDVVVIGVTYISLGGNLTNNLTDGSGNERFELFYNQSNIRENASFLYTANDLAALNYTPDLWYYKKYILSSITHHLKLDVEYTNDYFVDPIGYNYRIEYDKSRMDELGVKDAVLRFPNWHQNISTNLDAGQLALNYLINALQDMDIDVVCVSLPLHPYHSELVTAESRANYHNYLNSTGVAWYDFERGWDAKLFRDHGHMGFAGAMAIAPAYADMIIQEVNHNAIYHS